MKKLCFFFMFYVFLSFSCKENYNAPVTKSEPAVPPINKSLALKPPLGWNSWDSFGIYQFETDFIIWTADIPDSKDKYVALFNISDKKDPVEIVANWEQLGLSEPIYNVRDLWGRKNLGSYKDGFKQAIKSHGAGLYRISKSQ